MHCAIIGGSDIVKFIFTESIKYISSLNKTRFKHEKNYSICNAHACASCL